MSDVEEVAFLGFEDVEPETVSLHSVASEITIEYENLMVFNSEEEVNSENGNTSEPESVGPYILDLRSHPGEVDSGNNSLSPAQHDSDADTIILDSASDEKSKIKEPSPNKKRKLSTGCSDQQDDGTTCSICFDAWNETGDHRLCCLKCGHLFGRSCIVKWLGQRKKCPQCNVSCSAKTIRNLYATKVFVNDNKVDLLEKENDELKLEKNRLEAKVNTDQVTLEHLRAEIFRLKANQGHTSHTNTKSLKFHSEKTIMITEGGSRVMAYDPISGTLLFSQYKKNGLFPGYGMKKITNIGTSYTCSNFIFAHQKMLRDMCIHPTLNDLVLSVGFDQIAKVINLQNGRVLKSVKCEHTLWSCCWDFINSDVFYVGSGHGVVTLYDLNKVEPLSFIMPTETASGPVISLKAVPASDSALFPRGGLICCRINAITIYERRQRSELHTSHLILLGPFISLTYDAPTQHILSSSRPSADCVTTRHVFSELFNRDDEVGSRIVDTYYGGTQQSLLARSTLIRVGSKLLVAAGQEITSSIEIWDTESGIKIQSLSINDLVVDLMTIYHPNKVYLVALSDKCLRFYEAPL